MTLSFLPKFENTVQIPRRCPGGLSMYQIRVYLLSCLHGIILLIFFSLILVCLHDLFPLLFLSHDLCCHDSMPHYVLHITYYTSPSSPVHHLLLLCILSTSPVHQCFVLCINFFAPNPPASTPLPFHSCFVHAVFPNCRTAATAAKHACVPA